MDIRRIIFVVVALVIALVMTPLVIDIANDVATGLTGAAATVIGMVPVFYVLMALGIAAFALKDMWGKGDG